MLEVPELIEPPDAVLQRLGVEHRAFDKAHLAPDHVVASRAVPDERNAVDEVLLSFLQPHRHIDSRPQNARGARTVRAVRAVRAVRVRVPVGCGRSGRWRGRRRVAIGRRRKAVVLRVQIRVARELHVPAGTVRFLRLLQSVTNVLLAVPLALFDLEHRAKRFALDDGVALEVEIANAIPGSFGDGYPQLNPARLAVLRVLERLDLGIADARAHVALLAIVPRHHFRVRFVLVFLVGGAPEDRDDPLLCLVFLHLARQGAVAECLVADEVDIADPQLRSLADRERHVHQLRAAGDRRDRVVNLGVGEALLRHHLVEDRVDATQRVVVAERIQAQLEPLLFQLLGNLGAVDVLRALVVDDLDALALLHVVDDDLPDDAVGENIVSQGGAGRAGRIADLNSKVIEKIRRPQALEVVRRQLLRAGIPRHPHVLRGQARTELDVIQIRLWFDDRGPALLREARDNLEHDRGGSRGRQRGRRRNRQAAHRGRIAVRSGGILGRLGERGGRADRGQQRRGCERSNKLLLHQRIPEHLSLQDLLKDSDDGHRLLVGFRGFGRFKWFRWFSGSCSGGSFSGDQEL